MRELILAHLKAIGLDKLPEGVLKSVEGDVQTEVVALLEKRFTAERIAGLLVKFSQKYVSEGAKGRTAGGSSPAGA